MTQLHLAKRALQQWPKSYSNTAALVALDMESEESLVLGFLKKNEGVGVGDGIDGRFSWIMLERI